MLKSQWIVLAIACVLVLGIYQLPKAVVSNQDKKLASTSTAQEKDKTTDHSSSSLTTEQKAKLIRLKKEFALADNSEKRLTFADSIAGVFRLANRLDSGAYYIALAIEKEPSEKNWLKAGNAYFEAFQFAISVDAQRADSYGEKARDFYKRILDKNPENYLAKANMAMTYTVTPNPMQGIGLLREILAKDENNQLALLNLGLLSMQSGQHDKAIQRFEKLLEVNPQHIEAKYYLGQSYMNKGDKAKARELFTAISQTKADSLAPYRASASDYLKELK